MRACVSRMCMCACDMCVLVSGVDLGCLEWWSCNANGREVRAKSIGPRPL